jgi:uncharacterized protein YjbI with pentapeptide repeats
VKLLITIVCLSTVLFSYDVKDLEKLKTTNVCIECDLTNANLSGYDFSKAKLTSSDLTNANISNSNFFNADFWGAKLINLNGSNSNFRKANFEGTII